MRRVPGVLLKVPTNNRPLLVVLVGTLLVVLLALWVLLAMEWDQPEDEEEVLPPPDLSKVPGLDLGYVYRPDVLRRFRELLKSEDWTPADPPRNPQGMLEAVHNGTGLKFVLVPGGSFRMGSPEGEGSRYPDEGPVHTVTLPAFMLSKTECTQRAWEKGRGKNESRFKGADLPVAGVEFRHVTAWLSRVEGSLRLPAEAEWEYACRAGTTTPFSAGRSLTTDQANYDGNYPYPFVGGQKGQFRMRTVEVGSLPPNPWGLYEMHGNLWEWCEDEWHATYEGAPMNGSAWATKDSWSRVLRGGGWSDYASACRSAARTGSSPHASQHDFGFRPAADLPD